MTDEISFGKARIVLLAILTGLIVVFFQKLFSIKISLSFWILAAVAIVAILFIVLLRKSERPALSSLTAKIPSWKTVAGWVIVLVVVGVLVLGAMQIGGVLHQIKTGGLVKSDASTEQGLDVWTGTDGVRTRGNCFILPPGSSMSGSFKGTRASVALINPEGNGKIKISFEDLYDYSGNFECVYRKDAEFIFGVTKEGVTSSNIVKFGNAMSSVKLAWSKNETREKWKGNHIAAAVNERTLASCYGTKGGYSHCIYRMSSGYSQERERPFNVTIKNLSDEELLIDDIWVVTQPPAI